MAAWAPPTDADLAPGKPAKPSQARAIRDLFAALAEIASGSPHVNSAGDFYRVGGSGAGAGQWVVPDDVSRIDVTIVGGGGAGGGGVKDGVLHWPGGGGGAGATQHGVVEVLTGQVFSFVIGAGGDPISIDPSVDTTLDDFVIGDGARTVFGDMIAAGGKRGETVSTGGSGGEGGAGGADVVEQPPPQITPGGDGEPGYTPLTLSQFMRSGRGGTSSRGGGSPGKISSASTTGAGVRGAGGAGGFPSLIIDGTTVGTNGGEGLIIVRW